MAGVVTFYGIPKAGDLTKIKARILGHFGQKDPRCYPSRVSAFEKTLREAGVTCELHRYDAGNGFFEPVDAEGRYLQTVLREDAPAESRLAAALLAIRACFFNSHYDGALLAAEQGLALLDRANVAPGAVEAAFAQLDDPCLEISTVEIDATVLGGPAVLRALFCRQAGHVHVFNGDFDLAFSAYDRALAQDVPPERQAQTRMYRALTMVKRLGQLEAARAELTTGLGQLRGRPGEDAALQAGWLHNLFALTYFMEKRLEPAREQQLEGGGGGGKGKATHVGW